MLYVGLLELLFALSTLLQLGALAAHAQSDDYPVRPLRIVTPVARGRTTDLLCRNLSEKAKNQLAQDWQEKNGPAA
jgi:tripartite-type tricarboxylate transporter receptor subunit TctC